MTTLIKLIHKKSIKEHGLDYIDPKKNRVITIHSFRSICRYWSADETNYPMKVYEHVLVLKLPDEVEAAHLRGSYLEKFKVYKKISYNVVRINKL